MADLPTLRWGIVATGMISEWFVSDILRPNWPDKKANHVVQAIGSSSLEKCQKFTEKYITPMKPANQPTLYGSYDEVYNDPNVEVVYIGTPHSFHHKNALDAINAGKHVLCEKSMTLTAKQAEEVFAAAEKKNVFIMEAMWTRFFPLVKTLQKLLHEEKRLGTIHRTFCDFAMHVDIPSLPAGNRYKELALGAGSLLDIGIYSLTWGLVTLSGKVGDDAEQPEVQSSMTIEDGIETSTQMLLHYRSTGRQGIITSTTNVEGRREFARIEGSKGYIVVYGDTPSLPRGFTFHPKGDGAEEDFTFENPGRGFYWEADAVALDIQAGKKQDATMPWAETLRVLRIFDDARKRGGARFPIDDW